MLERRLHYQGKFQPLRKPPGIGSHGNPWRDWNSRFCQTVFCSGFVISQEASLRVRSHDSGTAVFQQKPDQWTVQSAPIKGIGVIDDEVARFREPKRLVLNSLGIGEEYFVTQSMEPYCNGFSATTGRMGSADNANAHV
jgi:hypothetical protein